MCASSSDLMPGFVLVGEQLSQMLGEITEPRACTCRTAQSQRPQKLKSQKQQGYTGSELCLD